MTNRRKTYTVEEKHSYTAEISLSCKNKNPYFIWIHLLLKSNTKEMSLVFKEMAQYVSFPPCRMADFSLVNTSSVQS